MLVTDQKPRARKKRTRNNAHRTYARTHNKSAANLEKNMKRLLNFFLYIFNVVGGPQDLLNTGS